MFPRKKVIKDIAKTVHHTCTVLWRPFGNIVHVSIGTKDGLQRFSNLMTKTLATQRQFTLQESGRARQKKDNSIVVYLMNNLTASVSEAVGDGNQQAELSKVSRVTLWRN